MPGPPFYFLAIVALVTLATAVRFAFRPSERLLSILRPLCAATIFADLTAALMGVANGLNGLKWAVERAAGNPGAHPLRLEYLLGFGVDVAAELAVGFAVVAVSWLLVAVGLRRQA